MSKIEPFPWVKAMEFGFGELRLSSAEFWALTPRELAAAMQYRTPRGLTRSITKDLRMLIDQEQETGRAELNG